MELASALFSHTTCIHSHVVVFHDVASCTLLHCKIVCGVVMVAHGGRSVRVLDTGSYISTLINIDLYIYLYINKTLGTPPKIHPPPPPPCTFKLVTSDPGMHLQVIWK